MHGMIEVGPMAKKHGGERSGAGRPKGERDDIAVKIDRGVAARARFVAETRGLTLAEYLSEAIRPIVERDFSKASQSPVRNPGEKD